jgi:hypothetical protein
MSMCMCGAEDCPRCYPGCNEIIKCDCGHDWVAHDTGTCECCSNATVCGECFTCTTCTDKLKRSFDMTNLIAILAVVIMQIESGGHPDPANALGDYNPATGKHEAIGAYQLHDIGVDEANRVERILAQRAGRTPRVWTSDERLCPDKSREMFEITMEWHYRRGVTDLIELGAKHHRPYGKQSSRYRELVRKGLENFSKNN